MAGSESLPSSFGALLQHQAERLGDRPFLRLLDEQEHETVVTFRSLEAEARRYAEGLQREGVGPGDRVFLMLQTGLPLLASLFACHLLGAVPVPLYPPFQLKGVAPYLQRLGRIVEQVQGKLLLCEPNLPILLRAGLGAACPPLFTPETLPAHAGTFASFDDPDHPALIQFSSGSTGPQKGVVLTHGQLMANCRAIAERLALRDGMRGVSWLPLYHDMGLVGSLFIPLLVGLDGLLFSPRSFLLDPALWLKLADRMRAEIIMGPNFAYRLLLRRVNPADWPGLDLSCLRIALNGAEPIDPATVRRFEAHFAPLGLRPGVMLGVYGLAEVGLGVTIPAPGSGTGSDSIDAERLRRAGTAQAPASAEAAREVASVGLPLPGYQVEIRDAEGKPLPERHEGAIAVHGPSIMRGYWRNPGDTTRVLQDGWLLTGDLGYMVHGELHVTGRSKDLIIRGGRNYHPQELENAAESVAGVRGGSAVAFGVADHERGTEQVVVAFETRLAPDDHPGLTQSVAQAVHAATGLRPDAVLALKPGSVPKTTSGKRQRQASRELYEQGRLGRLPSALDALREAAGNHLPGLLRHLEEPGGTAS